MTRYERLMSVLMEWDNDPLDRNAMPEGMEGLAHDALEKILLVERNARGGIPPYWFTNHDSLKAAGRYHVEQEYAADWAVVCAINLDNGLRYEFGGYDPIWIAPVTVEEPA